jgi:hypothetical protein
MEAATFAYERLNGVSFSPCELTNIIGMKNKNPITIFGSGAAVGVLGGLIGLGGAEFRLPLLIGIFGGCCNSFTVQSKHHSVF